MRGEKIQKLLYGIVVAITIVSCQQNTNVISETPSAEEDSKAYYELSIIDALAENSPNHAKDGDYEWNDAEIVSITLIDNAISINGNGATASGSVLSINTAGTYKITGTLTDGQILVNSSDQNPVRLIFDGINIKNSNSAPIFISNAEKTIIVLNDGTKNYLADADTYVFANAEDNEPNASIFSKDDLSFAGNGTLYITANYNDAITSKDGLAIKNGTFIIDAKDDGIRGKDYINIEDGNFTINAGGDGLKSDNEDDPSKGYIFVESGSFNIIATNDGLQAKTDLLVADGNMNVTTGGGSSKAVSADHSAKAFKAVVNIIVDYGIINLNSADDAIHSNGIIAINDGNFVLSSADDGLHADDELTINGGDITIEKSYEGLESELITINSGTIHLNASDDGINAANGETEFGDPQSVGSSQFFMNDGYVFVNANGDGIDINGSAKMTNGTLIVNGPTENMNGPLDYDGDFILSGGLLLASGSSGMAQAPGATSTQNCLLVNFTSTQMANTMVHIQNSEGEHILSFVPIKNFQSLAFSSPLLKNGTRFDVYLGGSSTGTNTDGLISNGSYSAGTLYINFTISSIITQIGSSSNPGGGGPGGGPRG